MKFKVILEVETEGDPAQAISEEIENDPKQTINDNVICLRYFLIDIMEIGMLNLGPIDRNTMINKIRKKINKISFDIKKENIEIIYGDKI
jgi:hypothetical protein